ncbi:MAG: alpha/beta hydrolase-fold protein, partial [Bacteroidota bacterium]
IPMKYRDEKKTIRIYTPPNYDLDSIARFPVVYMLDGQASFNDLVAQGPEWELDEVINEAVKNGKQGSIVVAIDNAEDRDAEYTPFINEDNPNAHGNKFAIWVANDLKAWVDQNYRTKKEVKSTSIGGISRSGMMAYYMLMAHPDVFGNAIIQSPAMWVDYDRLMAMQLSDEQLKNKKIFVSVGGKEGRIMIPHAKDIYEKFKTLGLKDDQLRFELIPKEGHWNLTWRKSFALAYPFLIGE